VEVELQCLGRAGDALVEVELLDPLNQLLAAARNPSRSGAARRHTTGEMREREERNVRG
jgi:hypothetical protein